MRRFGETGFSVVQETVVNSGIFWRLAPHDEYIPIVGSNEENHMACTSVLAPGGQLAGSTVDPSSMSIPFSLILLRTSTHKNTI